MFFDFDGVIVDSVSLKTTAYQEIFRPFGAEVVEYVTTYHKAHGGVDRHRKIRHILERFNLDVNAVPGLALQFASLVKDQVVAAPVLEPAFSWLTEAAERGCPCFVVSGTPEDELLDIVEQKRLGGFFQAVRGSPDEKQVILEDLLMRYSLEAAKAVFIGDACTDFQAAQAHGILFVGVSSGIDGVQR